MPRLETHQNFETALTKLEQFVAQEIEDERDRAGLIQGFEFTYEQCWRAIQKRGREEGQSVTSPRQAFAAALQWGWISADQELLWLQMIEDRNRTTHVYREAVAIEVATRISADYTPAFVQLLARMKE